MLLPFASGLLEFARRNASMTRSAHRQSAKSYVITFHISIRRRSKVVRAPFGIIESRQHSSSPLRALILAAALSYSSAGCGEPVQDLDPSFREGPVESPGTGAPAGVGIGQLACGDFIQSAKRLRSGQDDGLYHAFLAWRDGFVTAMTKHDLRAALASDQADRWLGQFCRLHPNLRFAKAVAAFVRQISGIRTAQR